MDWISNIFYSTRVSLLIDDSLTSEFSPERGLRQGDPLSPLLFNLVAEVLHIMLIQDENQGIFKGVIIGDNNSSISHLQYADDIIIFLKNDTSSIKGIKSVLQRFFILSGLKVNFDKSQLYGFHEDKDNLRHWADILGCAIGEDRVHYLGANISSSPRYI